MFNIFQNPVLLLIVAFAVFVTVVMIRQSLPDKRRWWQLLLPVLFIALAFGVDHLVKTDNEQINSLIDLGIKGFTEEDADQVEITISPDYSDSLHRSREQLMARCRSMVSEPLVKKIKTRHFNLTISSPKAAIECEFIVHLQEQSVYSFAGPIKFVKMNLQLEKTVERGWLINTAELISIDNHPITWKGL